MSDWSSGNRLRLLENGEELYPRLFEVIEGAKEEVLLETFIWFEDEVGTALMEALVRAAGRKVRVRVMVDGYGSPAFSPEFLGRMIDAGIEVVSFDPQPTLFRVRTNLLCRLHRKIVVVDDAVAFVGGINYSADHLRSFGDASKQDYAVEVRGPAVAGIRDFCRHGNGKDQKSSWKRWRYWLRRFPRQMRNPRKDAQVLFVTRDNDQHPTDIETMYRFGIRTARESIIIANAYFFPGYRFTRDLRRAAARGVDVKLLMQGNPDQPFKVGAASILFDDLLSSGVRVFLYTERPLHAKVAVIDRHWATVGSSNLDPTSLGLNLEANLFVLDAEFNRTLRDNLEGLLRDSATEIPADSVQRRNIFRRLLLTVGYHLTRRMASWGKNLPYHEQKVRPMTVSDRAAGLDGD